MDTTARETQVAERPARVAGSRCALRGGGDAPPARRRRCPGTSRPQGVGWLLAARPGLVSQSSRPASVSQPARRRRRGDRRRRLWARSGSPSCHSGWRTNALQDGGVSRQLAGLQYPRVVHWSLPLLVFKRIRHLRRLRRRPRASPGSRSSSLLDRTTSGTRAVRGGIEGSWDGYFAAVESQVALLAASLASCILSTRWSHQGALAADRKWVAPGWSPCRARPRAPGPRRPERRAGRGGDRGDHPAAGPSAGSCPTRSSRSATGGPRPPAWMSAGPAARPSAVPSRISSAWRSRRSTRSGWPGRPGRPRCGSRSRATRRRSCSASCTPAPICARTAGTSSAGSCSTGGWRTRSPSTPCAGWSSRRTTRCASCSAPGCPGRDPYGFVELTPEREYLLVTEFFDGGVELGEAEVDDDLIDQGLGIIRRLWDAGLAHRDVKPANLMVRDGRLPDRRRLRRGAPQPVAPGGRPGQHDAVPGAAHQPERVISGPCASSPRRRSARRSPPPAGSPCPPSCAG